MGRSIWLAGFCLLCACGSKDGANSDQNALSDVQIVIESPSQSAFLTMPQAGPLELMVSVRVDYEGTKEDHKVQVRVDGKTLPDVAELRSAPGLQTIGPFIITAPGDYTIEAIWTLEATSEKRFDTREIVVVGKPVVEIDQTVLDVFSEQDLVFTAAVNPSQHAEGCSEGCQPEYLWSYSRKPGGGTLEPYPTLGADTVGPVAELPAAATTRGDTWTVSVTPKRYSLLGAPATATVKVHNHAPECQVVELALDKDAQQAVCSTDTVWDHDGDPLTCGARFVSSSGSTLRVEGFPTELGGCEVRIAWSELPATVGQNFWCVLEPDDGYDGMYDADSACEPSTSRGRPNALPPPPVAALVPADGTRATVFVCSGAPVQDPDGHALAYEVVFSDGDGNEHVVGPLGVPEATFQPQSVGGFCETDTLSCVIRVVEVGDPSGVSSPVDSEPATAEILPSAPAFVSWVAPCTTPSEGAPICDGDYLAGVSLCCFHQWAGSPDCNAATLIADEAHVRIKHANGVVVDTDPVPAAPGGKTSIAISAGYGDQISCAVTVAGSEPDYSCVADIGNTAPQYAGCQPAGPVGLAGCDQPCSALKLGGPTAGALGLVTLSAPTSKPEVDDPDAQAAFGFEEVWFFDGVEQLFSGPTLDTADHPGLGPGATICACGWLVDYVAGSATWYCAPPLVLPNAAPQVGGVGVVCADAEGQPVAAPDVSGVCSCDHDEPTDADGEEVGLLYAWSVGAADGPPLAGANGPLLPLAGAVTAGDFLFCRVTPQNSDGTEGVTQASKVPISVVDAAPNTGQVSVLAAVPLLKNGAVTCSAPDALDPDGTPIDGFTYRLFADGALIDTTPEKLEMSSWEFPLGGFGLVHGVKLTCGVFVWSAGVPSSETKSVGEVVVENLPPVCDPTLVLGGDGQQVSVAKAGDVLTCSRTCSPQFSDGDGVEITYTWENAAGAELGKGPTLGALKEGVAVRCVTLVDDGDVGGKLAADDSALVEVVDTATAAQVYISPAGGGHRSQLYTCTALVEDADAADSATLQFTWCYGVPEVNVDDWVEVECPPGTKSLGQSIAPVTLAAPLAPAQEKSVAINPGVGVTPDQWLVCLVAVVDAGMPVAGSGVKVWVTNTAPTVSALPELTVVGVQGPGSTKLQQLATVGCKLPAGAWDDDEDKESLKCRAGWILGGGAPWYDPDADWKPCTSHFEIAVAELPGAQEGQELACVIDVTDQAEVTPSLPSAPQPIVDTPPILPAPKVESSPVGDGDVQFTCKMGPPDDPDVGEDSPLSETVTWLVDGQPAPLGVSGPGLLFSDFLIDVDGVAVLLVPLGASLQCVVTVQMGPKDAEVASPQSDPVLLLHDPPVVTSVAMSPVEPTQLKPPVCAVQIADSLGTMVYADVTWVVGGLAVFEELNVPCFAGCIASLPSEWVVAGETVSCVVYGDDGEQLSTAPGSDSAKAGNLPPVVGPPSVAGFTSGGLWSCEHAPIVDPDGVAASATYQWLLGGTPVGQDKTLDGAAVGLSPGKTLQCIVLPIDQLGLPGDSKKSDPTFTVPNADPSGSLAVNPGSGDITTLFTCQLGIIDSDATQALSLGEIQWLAGDSLTSPGVVVATGVTFVPKGQATKGQWLACRVEADDGVVKLPFASPPVVLADASAVVGSVVITEPVGTLATPRTCTVSGVGDPDGDAVWVQVTFEADGATLEAQTVLIDGEKEIVMAGIEGPVSWKQSQITCSATPMSSPQGGQLGDVVTSEGVAVTNEAPTLLAPFIGSSAGLPVTTDSQLTCLLPVPSDDGGSAALTLHKRWYVDGAEQVLYQDGPLPAFVAKKGQSVWCEASISDGVWSKTQQSAHLPVVNAEPGLQAVQLVGPIASGQVAKCVPLGYSDADADEFDPTLSLVVLVDETTGETLTEPALKLVDEHWEFTPTAASPAKGHSIACQVTPSDGAVLGDPVGSNAVVRDNVPPYGVTAAFVGPDLLDGVLTGCLVTAGTDPDDSVLTHWVSVVSTDGGVVLPKTQAEPGSVVPVELTGVGCTSVVCKAWATDTQDSSATFTTAPEPVQRRSSLILSQDGTVGFCPSAGAQSLELWLRSEATALGPRIVLRLGAGSDLLEVRLDDGAVTATYGGTLFLSQSLDEPTTGEWFHLAVEGDGADCAVYLDGKLKASLVGASCDVPTMLESGSCSDGGIAARVGGGETGFGPTLEVDSVRVSVTRRYGDSPGKPATLLVVDGTTSDLWSLLDGEGETLQNSGGGGPGVIDASGQVDWSVDGVADKCPLN